jgi:glycosyltransferase involved in cell wall biosynthesis
VIVAVRRLVRRMGLENLIDAMAFVHRQSPDALLLIGGKGPLEGELRRRIQERNLEQHARLIGFIPDHQLPLAYRAADFSVVPTAALEGFGMIITESLACGTPCIGTDVGGIPEILRPFSESLLFESPRASGLADRINAVLQGRITLPDEQACRAYAVSRFAWSRVTQQVLAVFRETQGGVVHEASALSGP